MRQIKFRGKSVNTGEWVTGYYWCQLDLDIYWIIDCSNIKNQFGINVLPETLGQYIGVDTNGKDVYEGDISKFGYIIIWNENKSLFAEHYKQRLAGEFSISSYPMDLKDVEIIGNIHDNPELLK